MADNNKRLAYFDTASTALAAVLVRMSLVKENDPALPDVAVEIAAKALEEQAINLESALARASEADNAATEVAEVINQLNTSLETQNGKVAELETQLAALREASGNSDQAETMAALEEKVRTLTEDLNAANETIRKADSMKAQKLRKGDRAVKTRHIGSALWLKGGLNGDPTEERFETDREKLKAAMEGGKEVEIVLSNGVTELAGFDPIFTYPSAFIKRGADRWDLREPLLVKGFSNDTRVRGVGLLVDGEQIAYTEFPRPVKIPVGQEVKFDRMICF